MKKLTKSIIMVISIGAFMIMMSCKSETKSEIITNDDIFSITGHIKGYDFGAINIELHQAIDERGKPEKTHITQLKNGTFKFEGKTENSVPASIVFFQGDTIMCTLNFFNEAKAINLNIDVNKDDVLCKTPCLNILKYTASGSPLTAKYLSFLEEYNSFRESNSDFQDAFNAISKEYYKAIYGDFNTPSAAPASPTVQKQKTKAFDSINLVELNMAKGFKKQYALKNKASIVGLKVMLDECVPRLFDGDYTKEEIDEVLDIFKGLKNHPLYVSTIDRHKAILGLKIGEKAPNFSLKTPEGETVTLSDYKGKYVLIDFWAYYCKPCIAKIPKLKKLYAKYKDDGLEIIGIHGDKNAEKWLDIIKKHQQTWTQVLDKNAFKENSAVIKYGVQGFPSVFLVDQEGNLLETNLPSDDLEDILVKLFKH